MQKATLFMYTIQCINFKSKKCTHYCTWDIDWLHPSSCLSHCMAKIDNMVQNSGPYSILYALICPWPLPLFASETFHHASLPLFFLLAVDPDHFLDVHPLSECVTLLLSLVYVCFPIEGSWDAPLSYFRELVYHWSTFSSLVKINIHLNEKLFMMCKSD